MTDMFSEIEQDAEATEDLPEDKLGTVAKLANEQLRLEQEIDNTEKKLKFLKQQHLTVQQHELPSAMDELGLHSIKLTDGRQVEVKNWYRANITKDQEKSAFSWLRDNGNGDLIKNRLTLEFGSGQDEKAERAMKLLDSKGYAVTQRMTVHPQTLRAFVKNRIEAGADVPHDLLGVHVGRQTNIKL